MKKDSIYSPNCKNKFSFVNTKPSLNQNEVETSHRPAQSWVKSSRTIQRLGLGGDKIICLPPKAAFYSILYCMNGQRDGKDILSTPKRKKHHIDYTHINKNEQKELGERRITSCWTQAAFGGRQNGFVYPQRRHSVRSHMSNVVVSIVQVITVRPRAWQKVSLIQDAVDRHQTHQTYNKKERSQLNLELNHLALYRGLVWGETK